MTPSKQEIEKFKKISKDPQLIDKGIEVYEEMVKEIEEALRNNVEYPSDKQRYELGLTDIKEKKGWFFNLLRKYVKYKLKKSINKPSKKLNKNNRRFLKEQIEKYKWSIATLKE